jgi:predicted transcriptional regulator of viral defense system
MNVPAPRLRTDLAHISRAAHKGIISVADAARALGTTRAAAATRLATLKRRGWLHSVRRGLFLVVPLEADPARQTTVEDPWILATQLFKPCYMGGWTAAQHWELTEQIFRPVFVVSGAHVRRSRFEFLKVTYRVIKVPRARIDRATAIWRGPERVLVSDGELTIADALVAPNWVGGLRHLAEMIRTYHQSTDWNATRLLKRLEQVGKGGGFKRLGWLLEQLFPTETEAISACLRRRSAGLVALDPGVASKGRINKRWGLRINVALDG